MLHNITEDLTLKNAIDNALKRKDSQEFIKMLNDHYRGKSMDLILVGFIMYASRERAYANNGLFGRQPDSSSNSVEPASVPQAKH